jgi:4-amino-4-deoxy-L-arabinose transferase-like glycosyltransferase
VNHASRPVAEDGPIAEPPSGAELRPRALALVAVAVILALGPGLGSFARLSSHEAIVAQCAREMLASDDWLVPRIGGTPWVEKPPLGTWLVAALGWLRGGRIDAATARLPSVLAAAGLAVVVAWVARSPLPGLVVATTVWLLQRGRLADADMLLAFLVAASVAAFGRVREPGSRRAWWPAAFWLLWGASGLAKGVGFGPVLVAGVVAAILAWDRDTPTLRRLLRAWPFALAGLALASAWPFAVASRLPGAPRLWLHHLADRMGERSTTFATESWPEYVGGALVQLLPWLPLGLVGLVGSYRRAKQERFGPDRLLLAWAVVPAVAVSVGGVRNAHYLLPSLAPWAVWSASRLEYRLGARPGAILCLLLALVAGVGVAVFGPRFDPKGAESAWYERVGRLVPAGDPILLIADAWDRAPYPTPFGPVPADLAVRLFSLARPPGSVSWIRLDSADRLPSPAPTWLIARERDLPALKPHLGLLTVVDRGPTGRWDRAFVLLRKQE